MPVPYQNGYWPSNYEGSTLTGVFIGLDGAPMVGQVTLVATPKVLLDYAALKSIFPRALSLPLDSSGSIGSVIVPATDDPDISPVDWTYTVTQEWQGGLTFSIEAPQGETVDLTTVTPVPDSPGDPIVRGPQGLPGGAQTVQRVPFGENGDVDLTGVVLLVADNLSDLADAPTARTHLGLGSVATHNVDEFATSTQVAARLIAANNLSDLADIPTAVNHLGLTDALHAANNLSDVASVATAQLNLEMPLGYLEDGYDGASRTLPATATYYGPLNTAGVATVTLASRRRLRVTAAATIVPGTSSNSKYTGHCSYSTGSAFHASSSSQTGRAAAIITNAANFPSSYEITDTVDLAAGTYSFAATVVRLSGDPTDAAQNWSIIVDDMGPG